MCGIAGFISTKAQNQRDIHQALIGIESRGGHAWGWASLKEFYKQVGKVPTITKELNLSEVTDPSIMILHSRWATHGRADDVSCAHPFVSQRWAIVHNGVISNNHPNQKTQCDSEAILKLLLEHNDVKKVCEEIMGDFRIAIIDRHKKQLIIVNDNCPVWFGKRTEHELWFGSESKHLPTDCWMRQGKINSIMTFSIVAGKIQVKVEPFNKKARVYADTYIYRGKTMTFDEINAWESAVRQRAALERQQHRPFNYAVCKQCDAQICDGCEIVRWGNGKK